VWTFGAKVGAALSLAVTGALLHLGGFAPGEPIARSGELAIRIACSLLPAAALLGSLALLSRVARAPAPSPAVPRGGRLAASAPD
jgi:Na+/melibiose symporter-like transporter